MPSIFVSVASYRDSELAPTIRSLIDTRTGDTALHIRILAQGGADEALADGFPGAPGVTIDQTVIPAHASRGVCWARAEIQRAYAGEDFYLQLDSHMQMARGWDEILLADHRAASVERPAVLTAYLPPYELPMRRADRSAGPIGETRPDHLPDHLPVHFKVVQQGWLPTAEQTIGFAHPRPVRAPFFSGHFAFARGRFVEDVPYDPELFFFGEEITMALRAYCCGYDLFTPSRFVGAHLYHRPRPLYWDADQDGARAIGAAELDQASKIKVGAICRGEWRGRFGIRDMVRYAAFRTMLLDRFGVDLGRATPPG